MSDWLCPFPKIRAQSEEFLVALSVVKKEILNTGIKIPVLSIFLGTPDAVPINVPKDHLPVSGDFTRDATLDFVIGPSPGAGPSSKIVQIFIVSG